MKYIIKILAFLILIVASSCLDDNDLLTNKIELNQTAKILHYIESTGDFANTNLAPALVSATDLYNNITQYFVLDIRTSQEFLVGHISSAMNISNSKLYQTVDSLYTVNPLKKIVIVSKNGQASTYFVCLLRLAGFTNVYSLRFGMASWNFVFADEWYAALGSSVFPFSNIDYPKRPFTNLPTLEFPPSISSDKEKTIYRIKELINNGFLSGINYEEYFSSDVINSHFLICYGQVRLYSDFSVGGAGHPKNTVWFKDSTLFEFRSTNSLQTLPIDQSILIYSGDGHLSACMAAYLKLLGYDVKTLLFGANQLLYSRLATTPAISNNAFTSSDIMNYPYTPGN